MARPDWAAIPPYILRLVCFPVWYGSLIYVYSLGLPYLAMYVSVEVCTIYIGHHKILCVLTIFTFPRESCGSSPVNTVG